MSVPIMRRVQVRQIAPDQMCIVEDGGWAVVFGMLFLLPGLLIMIIGLQKNFMANGIPLLSLFGLIFVLVGGDQVFKRRWTTLNITRQRMITQWGWIAPLFGSERSLHEFTTVTTRYNPGGRNSTECYLVILTARTGSKDVIVKELKAYGEAYTLAAQLATFLRLTLTDATTRHTLSLSPTEVAHPLQARLQTEASLPVIVPPEGMFSQVQESAVGVQLTIPGRMTKRLLYIIMFVFCLPLPVIAWIVLSQFPPSRSISSDFQAYVIGIMGLPAVILLLVMLGKYWKAVRTRTVVTIGNQGVKIDKQSGLWIAQRLVIPIADILDIDYAPAGSLIESRGVMLKTKSDIYSLGAGLPDREVEYLADTVKRALRRLLGPTSQSS